MSDTNMAHFIPKFIVLLQRDEERCNYIHKNVLPKLNNHYVCNAVDCQKDNMQEILDENELTISEEFKEKCRTGQLACFLSHYKIWQIIAENNLDYAIVMEDDIKIFDNFNENINKVFNNLPVKFDYVHLFLHPSKIDDDYDDEEEGSIRHAVENFGTVAYIITKRGAKKMLKITNFLGIHAPVDRQINFYVENNIIKAYMVKKPFVLTFGDLLPNKNLYKNGFKSNIWYSEKLEGSSIKNKNLQGKINKINDDKKEVADITKNNQEKLNSEAELNGEVELNKVESNIDSDKLKKYDKVFGVENIVSKMIDHIKSEHNDVGDDINENIGYLLEKAFSKLDINMFT